MENSILTAVILPISLAIIMLGMGLSLVLADFKRVFNHPKAALIGLGNQLLLLPLIAFVLVTVFNAPPIMAVGIMLLAACPGGVTSNLISHVAKGDIALSISLTAITSLVTVISIPLIMSFSLAHFINDTETQVELPVLKTIAQIMVITVIPVSLGMLIRHFNTAFANTMERPMRIASTIIFVAVLLGIILANKALILPALKSIGLVAALLNISTMALGFFAAKLFQLHLKQAITITIESGIQNGTLAIVIATSILQQPDMSIPAAIYSLLMLASGGMLMWFFGMRKE